jgi:hypothetical protein
VRTVDTANHMQSFNAPIVLACGTAYSSSDMSCIVCFVVQEDSGLRASWSPSKLLALECGGCTAVVHHIAWHCCGIGIAQVGVGRHAGLSCVVMQRAEWCYWLLSGPCSTVEGLLFSRCHACRWATVQGAVVDPLCWCGVKGNLLLLSFSCCWCGVKALCCQGVVVLHLLLVWCQGTLLSELWLSCTCCWCDVVWC